ncbi:MAG TPA: BatA domain-containing protein [Planctomycetota bacterium]|nr:BatA domain-containing protein [Planctomycetota bacterium]
MSFAAPWALLGLLSLPVIVGLHLWRRRLPERRVAGLFLWSGEAAPAPAGRVRTPLRRTASLLLELLAAASLALLLAGPRLGAGGDAAHLLFVLDDSASMGARAEGGSSAADRARAAALAALDEAGEDARGTLVLTGARAEILAGPRAPVAALRAALAAWSPQAPGHPPDAALDLARQLAGPADGVLFLTDDPAASVPPEVTLRAVGAPLQNAAITGARRVPGPDGEHLYVDVTGFGERPLDTTLSVLDEARGTLLGEQAVRAEAGATARLSYLLPVVPGAVRVRLSPDALPLDGDVLLLPEPLPLVAACDLLSTGTSRALALDRALAAIEGVVRTADPAAAQLLLSSQPGELVAGRVELVITGAAAAPGPSFVGPFLLDRRDPLLAGLTLDGVVWSPGAAAPPGVPLVLAGARPLLGVEEEGEALRVTLDLDPARSNLAASPDWPILLSNLVEAARARRAGLAWPNVRVGEEIAWRRPAGVASDARHELVGPDGTRQGARGVGMLGWVATRPGLYRVEVEGRELAQVAVRFDDAGESDLTRRGAASRAATELPGGPAAASLAGGRREATVLALLILAAALADWAVLRRGASR